MRVIYIAGPYASPTHNGVLENILRAREVAAWVWQHGGVGLCPHTMTAFMDGVVPREAFLQGDLALLRRSDAALVLPGWRQSQGTLGEIAEAERVGLPVYYWPGGQSAFEKWLREEV